MSQPEHTAPRTILQPHLADLAARKALEQRPPAPLERVLEQAAASRKFIAEWRAKGLPDLPARNFCSSTDHRSPITDHSLKTEH